MVQNFLNPQIHLPAKRVAIWSAVLDADLITVEFTSMFQRLIFAPSPLFLIVLLVVASSAEAGQMSYSIVNYPMSLGPDTGWYPLDGTATLSGTIITDGATGALAPSDILSASFTVMIPGQGTFSGDATSINFAQGYGLFAGVLGSGANNGGTQYGPSLYLQPGAAYGLLQGIDMVSFAVPVMGPNNGLSGIAYSNIGVLKGFDLSSLQILDGNSDPYVNTKALFSKPAQNQELSTGASAPGSYIGESYMIVADNGTPVAVPEPSTFMLLGSALLGLGAVYLRKI